MSGAHRPPPYNIGAVMMLFAFTYAIAIIIITPHVAASPLKAESEALDIVDIVTNIDDKDLEDVLGLNDYDNINADNTEDTDPAFLTDDMNNGNDTITTEGPPPLPQPLIISPGSANIKDEQNIIFEFPTKCPEGQKQDGGGKCRKPFAPDDGL